MIVHGQPRAESLLAPTKLKPLSLSSALPKSGTAVNPSVALAPASGVSDAPDEGGRISSFIAVPGT